jgi:hypothetical protein
LQLRSIQIAPRQAASGALATSYALPSAVSPNAINATLYDKLNFNIMGDIALVSQRR